MVDAATLHAIARRLEQLGIAIRDEVVAHRAGVEPGGLAEVVGEVTADVTYEIDRVSEARVVAWLRASWPETEPVRLVMEGLEDHELVTVPEGVDPRGSAGCASSILSTAAAISCSTSGPGGCSPRSRPRRWAPTVSPGRGSPMSSRPR